MPFKYIIESPERIIFKRIESGCGKFMFIFIGSIFTLIGVGLIAFGGGIEMPFALIRFIVPLFGVGAIYVGTIFSKIQAKTIPDQLIFDNKNGRIEVRQQHSEIKLAYIYYDEIEDFIVKAKKRETSSSSTTTTRSSYSYHIYLVKKDGGQWELMNPGSESAALEELGKLKIMIRLNAKSERTDLVVDQSSKYKISNDFQRTEISWRNKLGYAPVFLAAFSLLFITIGYVIFNSVLQDDDFPIFAYAVGGFIAIVFIIVVVGNAMKMIKNSKTTYAVVVTNTDLEYIERDLAGRPVKTVPFPLVDLHAISFSFDTDNTYRKIYIYTHEQFTKQKSMNISFSVQSIRDMYNFYKDLVALDMQELTAVEALHIENYLQQVIKEKASLRIA
jgi:hypothetical protein